MGLQKTFTQTVAGTAQRWHVFADFDALCGALIAQLGQRASEAIADRGVFSIVLAGGTTPQALYRELPELATDWRAWFIYFGDERCLPVGAEGRNDTMVRRSWLDHVPIPRQQIFSIPAERGVEQGATAYAHLLAQAPKFDLVLLGLGEDGHTASLFPGHNADAMAREGVAIAVRDAPKPPRERISLSAARLSDARDVWFVVSGEGKRSALQQLREGAAIPAATITPPGGIDVFTDVEVG